MGKSDLYYVVAEPQHSGDFRPVVIEYGIDLISAERVVRRHINDYGLRYKVKGKKYPAFVRIHRISDNLPEDYVLLKKVEATV